MKKVLKTTGWVLVGIFVIYTFYFLWKQSQPAPVVYELVTPEQRDVVQKTVATGTLEARTQVELTDHQGWRTRCRHPRDSRHEPAHAGAEFRRVSTHIP